MTSAASPGNGLGSVAAPQRADAAASASGVDDATPCSEATRCGRGTLVAPFAAAASVAIMPATPSTLARAWPWPQPSATTSTTAPPLHFSQSSSLRRRPSGPAAQRRRMPASSDVAGIRRIGAPSFLPAGSLSRRP